MIRKIDITNPYRPGVGVNNSTGSFKVTKKHTQTNVLSKTIFIVIGANILKIQIVSVFLNWLQLSKNSLSRRIYGHPNTLVPSTFYWVYRWCRGRKPSLTRNNIGMQESRVSNLIHGVSLPPAPGEYNATS